MYTGISIYETAKNHDREDLSLENTLITSLSQLGIIFLFAIIGGILANRFKQPIVLGLLLVGAIIGPFSLNLVNDAEMIDTMIEFGAILMLFLIGMEFSVEKLMKVGVKSIMIGTFKIGGTFFISYIAALILGLTLTEAIFIGVILSFTSTVVVAKILEQKDLIHREEVPTLMAVLIIEDFFAVLAITFFSGMNAGSGQSIIGLMEHVVIGIAALIIIYILGSKFAEKMVNWLMKNSGEEMIPFLALGICAGFSYLSYAIGLSPTAGAFLAGSIVSSFKESKVFEHAIKPYTLMFSSLFFIAIGTSFNFLEAQKYILLIAVLLIVLVIAIFVTIGLTTRIFANYSGEQIIFSSIAMISVGEFSLLIAKEAGAFGIGIDLMTITSVIVFISAILMSLGTGILGRLSRFDKMKSGYISHSRGNLANFSSYINSMFDEIDEENSFTKKFKNRVYAFLKLIPVLFVLLFGFRRILMLLIQLNASTLIIYIAYLLGVALIIGIVLYFNKRYRELHNILVQVVVNLDHSRSLKRTSLIISNTALGFVLLTVAVYSPMIIFFLGLSIVYLAFSGLIFSFGIILLFRAFKLIGNFNSEYRYSVPTYRKFDANVLRFKNQ